MEAETKQTTPSQTFDVYKWAAWFHENSKQVITGAAIVAIVGCVIGIYSWKKGQDEDLASQAVFNLPVAPAAGEKVPHPSPQALVSVASQYPTTSMGQQAELMAAKEYFTQGKFEDAQREFSKFLANHESSQFAGQAAVGVAASLEAQNKIPEALQAYKDALAKYANSGIAAPVKLNLARLAEDQKQYDQALRYYEELAASPNQFDTWTTEARDRKADLLAKHPELAKAAPVLTPAPAASVAMPPAANAAGPAAKPAPSAPAKK